MKVVIIGSTGLIGKTVAALLTEKGYETVQVFARLNQAWTFAIGTPSTRFTSPWARWRAKPRASPSLWKGIDYKPVARVLNGEMRRGSLNTISR